MLLDLWGGYYEWLRKYSGSGAGKTIKEPKFVFDEEEPEKRKKHDEVLLLGVHLWN